MQNLPSLLQASDLGLDLVAPGSLTPLATRALKDAKLLVAAAALDEVVCEACGEPHLEQVQWRTPATGEARAFITCPEQGRVWLRPEHLRGQRLDLERLAEFLARGLGCAGNVIRLVPGTLWVLGSRAVAADPFTLVLARQAGPGRLNELLVHEGLRPYPRRLVLTFGSHPAEQGAADQRWLPLEAILSDRDGSLSVSDAALVALVLGDGRHRAADAVESIPLPAGITARNLIMTVDDHGLTVSVGPSRFQRDYRQAGCVDRKTDKPDGQWATLRELAGHRGVWSINDRRIPAALTKRMERLREVLRAVLPGLAEDPLPFIKDDRVFRVPFTLRRADGPRFAFPADGWDGVTVVWAGSGKLAIELMAATRQGRRQQRDDGGEDVDAEVDHSVERHLLDLVEIGLADETGRANRSGDVLERFCRSRGSLTARGDDDAILKLNLALRRCFGTTQDALEWDDTNKRWMCAFEARVRPGM